MIYLEAGNESSLFPIYNVTNWNIVKTLIPEPLLKNQN